jgi:AmmeMemoRadiSam system protein B
MRHPAVAGSFYSGTEQGLREQIESCFTHELGPGKVPDRAESTNEIAGLVCPHAGYMYSGPVAAHSFAAIAVSSPAPTFVISGPNHSGMGALVSVMAEGEWMTPLGKAAIDEELAKEIVSSSSLFESEERAHYREHSIEVQIPFLQYIFGEIKFVPICMWDQHPETAEEIGKALAKVCNGRDVIFIASSDFTHYMPKETAEKLDKLAIDAILKMDPKALFSTIEEHDITMCGPGPVMATMFACLNMGYNKARLLKYATSGDVRPMGDVVGYASIAFEK